MLYVSVLKYTPRSDTPSPNRQIRRGMARPNQTSRVQNRPPQMLSNVELRHRYRFTSTSGTATALTPTSLMCAAGSIAVIANTLVTSVFSSVKLNRIDIWSPPSAQGSAVTCSVDWTGSNNSPNREYSDTSVSTATPAHVSCVPPPMSLASFWQQASATGLCTVTAPTGSIIDIYLSLIFQDDDQSVAQSNVTTATLANSYYLSADPNATHRFTPVSLTTTT